MCGPGDATGDTAQGVTGDSIQVGTISDPGFVGRPGLNQELFDASNVFVEWCNAAGGINGREIEIVERDAALTEFKQRITEACQEEFMLVGGGAVFDETGQEERLGCLLPDIPAYQVSPAARGADLAVRPLPTALDELPIGQGRGPARLQLLLGLAALRHRGEGVRLGGHPFVCVRGSQRHHRVDRALLRIGAALMVVGVVVAIVARPPRPRHHEPPPAA